MKPLDPIDAISTINFLLSSDNNLDTETRALATKALQKLLKFVTKITPVVADEE